MTPKIEKIIVKYITKSATSTDLDILSEWIETPANEKLFKAYVQTHYAVIYSINDPDSSRVLDRLLKEIKRDKPLFHRFYRTTAFKYVAAAVLVGIFAVAYTIRRDLFNSQTSSDQNKVSDVKNNIVPGTDKATLTLQDGSQIALEKGNEVKTQNAISNGEEIVYKGNKTKPKDIAYNYLTIPRGGQFFIKLSDGTQVWLNSESQLKYPVAFVEGETRKVELVYGEAYFEVSPSTLHKGAKFQVYNKSQKVEVIGTEFNIKAYRDESEIYTTLVKGVVAISTSSGNKILAPNQQSKLNLTNNTLAISQVNVDTETSWRRGLFSFKDKSLKEIMKVLARWYDVQVVFENKSLESLKFKGNLNKNQSIEEILSIMKSSTINNYEITDKTIIIR
ncbi:iron dicitrate transporter FecR [Yeosuana aromativorans]|uniref:Iron dicitrate transporter FecR n=1 Tax=Yeosuana aromativorans TaxID=288019 RepID=A0A8J3FDC1_9FLAO|nr:FecR family protein [Yeosuana aromativorans]GGK12272.1 iron dicitrate transporter FecR [Yeosuana aromativorans]